MKVFWQIKWFVLSVGLICCFNNAVGQDNVTSQNSVIVKKLNNINSELYKINAKTKTQQQLIIELNNQQLNFQQNYRAYNDSVQLIFDSLLVSLKSQQAKTDTKLDSLLIASNSLLKVMAGNSVKLKNLKIIVVLLFVALMLLIGIIIFLTKRLARDYYSHLFKAVVSAGNISGVTIKEILSEHVEKIRDEIDTLLIEMPNNKNKQNVTKRLSRIEKTIDKIDSNAKDLKKAFNKNIKNEKGKNKK